MSASGYMYGLMKKQSARKIRDVSCGSVGRGRGGKEHNMAPLE